MQYLLPDNHAVRICPNISACIISNGWVVLQFLANAGAFLDFSTRYGWQVMDCTTEGVSVGIFSDCLDIESNLSGIGFPRRWFHRMASMIDYFSLVTGIALLHWMHDLSTIRS